MRLLLIYDGECPFCANYVQLAHLRRRFPGLELVDARGGHPALAKIQAAGFKIDDGMALIDGDRIYHGADAIQRLSGIPSTLYPLLRAGRNLTLKLLGRTKLGF